jgi:hypothetical protein
MNCVDELHNFYSSPNIRGMVCNFLHPPVTSSLLVQIFSSAPCFKTPSVFSSVHVSNSLVFQVGHLFVTTYVHWVMAGEDDRENRLLINVWGVSDFAHHLSRNSPREGRWIWVERRRRMRWNPRGEVPLYNFWDVSLAATANFLVVSFVKAEERENQP